MKSLWVQAAMDYEKLCLKCMREGVSGGVCAYCGTHAGFAQEPPFALPPGTVLHGRYLTGAVLGFGGFGITYIAADLQDGHRVAIKEYMPSGLSTRRPGDTALTSFSSAEDFRYGLNQFLEEARTIYNLRGDPHIISVEKLFEENQTAYYVMEFLEGRDLKKYLKENGGKLSFRETSRLLSPVFDALERVHGQGIVHRDVSPDNIFLCGSGAVKLIDFGAARASLQERSRSIDVILKRGYAPEEQYRSHGKQGPWTDIYALGCTFYHCITGRVPPESTQRLAEDDCAPPSRFCPDLSKSAEHVLLKAMSVKAENRYQTVGAFRQALEAAASSANPGPTKPSVVTSTPVSPANGKQSAGKRLAAYVIDSLILSGIFLLLGSVIRAASLAQLALFSYAVSFAYGFGFESSSLRATPGKRLMKLQVTDCGGDILPKEKTALRNLVKFSPSLLYAFCPAAVALCWAAVDALALFFTASGQTLHDCAAHARVGAPIAYRAAMVPIAEESAGPVSQTGVRCLSGLYQGTFFPLGESKLVMGRNPQSCNVIFPADTVGVSALHCELFWDRSTETVILKDLGSTYGTFVSDGRKLGPQQIAVLRKQDSFTIGDKNTFIITAG